MADLADMTPGHLIETAPHEYVANYNFDDGLRPYFALDRVVKDHDGSHTTTFRHEGEQWQVKLYYQASNIVHPGDTLPSGTPFDLESIREFRLAVESVDDPQGERGFNAHVRPRWDRMTVEQDDGTERRLDVPLTEGVNVRVSGSNIEFAEYLSLLQRAAGSLGVKWSYFTEPHRSSNVRQAERYVRVHKDDSGPVHARDGPLSRMAHLLENDRDGHRKIEQRDMNERGEQLPGYRHQVAVDEHRIQEILPNHSYPKRVKHYYAREALSRPESDPLSHPKVGAIYYSSLWRNQDKKIGVSPEDLAHLNDELDELLLSVLSDAGLNVHTTESYVADAYFEPTTSERECQVVDLPLEDIEATQESVVIDHVADGLSPIQWESLKVLVTDGGDVSPEDIAESGGFHKDSVYRALDEIDDLVEREYGSVSLRSTHIGELVHDAVRQAKEATREAVEAGAKAIEASERGLDEKTSALVAWASQHLDSLREVDDDKIKVNVGTIKADSYSDAKRELRRILREGYNLWCEARKSDRPWAVFGEYSATLEWETEDGIKSRYLSEELFYRRWVWQRV